MIVLSKTSYNDCHFQTHNIYLLLYIVFCHEQGSEVRIVCIYIFYITGNMYTKKLIRHRLAGTYDKLLVLTWAPVETVLAGKKSNQIKNSTQIKFRKPKKKKQK